LVKKNEILTLNVTSVTAKGFGIGHVGDFVLFVDGGLTGDMLSIQIVKVKPRYGYGKILKVITPSPHRIQSPCPISDKCGGCQWQHCDYNAQLGFKKDIVTDALKRLGGIDNPQVGDVIGMTPPQPYRNKAVFPIVPHKDSFAIGMYAPRSHRIIPLDECAIQHPIHVPVLKALRDYMHKHKVSAYDETTHKGIMRYLIVRTSKATGEVMIVLVVNANSLPNEADITTSFTDIGATTIIINKHTARSNTIMGDNFRNLTGEGFIREQVGDIWYQLSAPSFFQINPVQTEILYRTAIDMAKLTGHETVMDAHVGVGGVALMAAPMAKLVIGVDIVADAISDATKNAAINSMSNTQFICGAAEKVIPDLLANGETIPDVVFLDPPRKGCEKELLEALIAAYVQTVVYISCDPATLARDIKLLTLGGYTLHDVQPVDMFPMTGKVETVALLRRSDT